jgi:hypothetical protein
MSFMAWYLFKYKNHFSLITFYLIAAGEIYLMYSLQLELIFFISTTEIGFKLERRNYRRNYFKFIPK